MSGQRTIVRNSLIKVYFLQGLLYLIPLIEVPLLARILGGDGYGELVVVQSAALLASMLVEYGFSLRATRLISINRGDLNYCGKVFWRIFFAKLLLASPIVIATVAASFVGEWSGHQVVYGLIYMVAFGFSCAWYYQGQERLEFATLIDVICRYSALSYVYFFLSPNADSVDALRLLALFAFSSTLITNFLVVIQLRFVTVRFREVWEEIAHGFSLFVYKGAAGLASPLMPLIVGAVSGPTTVGLVAAAEKAVKAFVALFSPVFLVGYPKCVKLWTEDDGKKRAMLAVRIIGAIALFSSLFVGVFSAGIVSFVLGEQFLESIPLMRLFAFSVFFRIASQALVYFVFLPNGLDRSVAAITSITTVLGLCALFPLAVLFGAIGAVFAIALGDMLALVLLARYTCKKL